MSVVIVVCCQVEVSATNGSLVQRSPTDWCVVVCDLKMRSHTQSVVIELNRRRITGCISYKPLIVTYVYLYNKRRYKKNYYRLQTFLNLSL